MLSKREQSHQSLYNVSALDGREAVFVQELRPILSEAGLHRHRAIIEIENLISLAESELEQVPPMSAQEKATLRTCYSKEAFDPTIVNDLDHFSHKGIGPLEHDVKSVEIYLGQVITEKGLHQFKEFLHFPLTSEDVNNLAYNLMLKESINDVWLPKTLEVTDTLAKLAEQYKDTPVIGKTHGMNASPTTIGKRFAYHLERFNDVITSMSAIRLKGKFSGPVGNHNAMHAIIPSFDMENYAKSFVESFGFTYSPMEHQRISHQDITNVFSQIEQCNIFATDLTENTRHAVMMGWLYQEGNPSHVGSSVMPHKINPWFFEVAEGYLEAANALIPAAKSGLLKSVFERDLTDHPWERLYGDMLGYSLVGMSYLAQGLDTIKVHEQQRLDETPEVLSEAVQIAGRLLGVDDIYMKIKEKTRGRTITKGVLHEIIEEHIPKGEIQDTLLALTPTNYTGLAAKVTEDTVKKYYQVRGVATHKFFDTISGYQAVLFDFDNTLQVGDKHELTARLSAIARELSMGFTPEDIKQFGDRSDYREMRSLMVNKHNQEDLGFAIAEEEFEETNKKYSGQFDDQFTLAPGAKELLAYLHANQYKTALVTTRGSNSLPRLLEMHGIKEYFSVIVNRDSVSERKPHPQPLLTALEQLNVLPEQAIYVGDKQVDDVISGNAINMKTILVNDEEADRYGAPPNHHFSSLNDVLTLFYRGK